MDSVRATVLLSAVLIAASMACHGTPASEASKADPTPESILARGKTLYAAHCAVCHGVSGDGRGPAAPFLFPKARDLTRDRFRLVRTVNGQPSDADIVATLRRGIPGSAMPAWSWLAERDVWSLAAYVRSLARESVDRGEVLRVPAPVEVTHADLERGARTYREKCASCHGEHGEGTIEPRRNENGDLDWARDFTAGFMKGGAWREDLWLRIRLGMPGTAMPASDLPDADLEPLVAYVRRMIPSGAEDRLVHARRHLAVKRVGMLPSTSTDAAWKDAAEIPVVLAPLYWTAAAVHELHLSAVHDGRSIAIRVRWDDATNTPRLFTDTHTSDAVALQFSKDAEPALFGMGGVDHPTSIWHWRSLRLSDIAGASDLIDVIPHVRGDGRLGEVRADVPIYRRAEGVPAVSSAVDRLSGKGIQSVHSSPRDPAEVDVSASATDGGWEVVFVRALEPSVAGDISFVAGKKLQVSCAVWNGAAGDAGARKSISIWQEIELER